MDTPALAARVKALMRSLKRNGVEYSDIMIKGPETLASGRLVLDPYSATIYSSSPRVFAEIEALGYRRLAELGASPLKSIRSAGGGAGNEVWTALRLQRLKVPQLPSASEQAAMGTARLAWRGLQLL